MKSNKQNHQLTNCIHAGHFPDASTNAVIPSISLSTTFKQTSVGKHMGYEYSRSDNPNRNQLEKCLAILEKGKHGLAFSSGSAATASIVNMLDSNSHIISVNDVYGGTYRYFTKVASTKLIKTTFVNMQDIVNIENSINKETKLIWLETPSNPTLIVTNIEKVAKVANDNNLILVVDNTFLSPILQNPLLLGAHIVVHSVTKYINGHSDVVMGVCVCNDDTINERLRFQQNSFGAVPSAFDCYLAHRGIKTLYLRMMKHCENALKVSEFLQGLEPVYVNKTIYPGLKSHPQHELASKQQYGYGGMVTFDLKTNDYGLADKFVSSLQIITLAESLGGIESLVEIPARMTHASVSENDRKQLGITDTLIRLSVGIEHHEDLIEDLKRGFKAIFKDFKQ